MMEETKKKSNTIWYVLGGIILLLGILKIMIVASYPSDEKELNELLCEKYWKISDVELKGLTIDGKDVSAPNNTIGKSISDKINDKRNTGVEWIEFENTLKKLIEHDNFFFAKKIDSQGYMIYEQYYDNDLNRNTFNLTPHKFGFIDSRFNLSFNQLTTFEYLVGGEKLEIQSEDYFDNFSMSIISISEDNLFVEISYSRPPNESIAHELKIKYTVSYDKFQPKTEYVNFANKAFTIENINTKETSTNEETDWFNEL
jgi:hypothetical protein